MILDCCFAGLACAEPAAGRAHLLMAVGQHVKATHDPSGTGPTHFTGALVELMRAAIPVRVRGSTWRRRTSGWRRDWSSATGIPAALSAACLRSGAIALGRNAAYSGSS